MSRLFLGLLLSLAFSGSVSYAQANDAKTANVGVKKKHVVFSDKTKAERFEELKKKKGFKTKLTTQNKPVKHYLVLLKGYTQWSSAFKQAQQLIKNGFPKVEVIKGRFERGYSVLAAQFLTKKSAGRAFNQLKKMGLRNVNIHPDVSNSYQYIVSIYQEKTRPSGASQTDVVKKAQSSADKLKSDASEEDKLLEDVIIVMSDASDINYDMDIEATDIENNSDWGADFAIEEELFTRGAQDASHTEFLQADAYFEKRLNSNWNFRLAARLDGTYQRGKHAVDYNNLELDYGDSYISYRDASYRVTLGAQTIRWGRVDNLGPLDNMATLDLSRGILPKWGENYRSSPAFRIESFFEQSKIDFVYLPKFREAELAEKNDVWHPIDINNGRMLGFKSSPVMNLAIKNARIDDDIDGDGGMGVRYSTTINSFDLAMTVQRVRLSTPYYSLHGTPGSLVFKEEHPRNWVVGVDAAFDLNSVTWRMEAGWFSDMPATTTAQEYKTYNGFKWATSAEFYPGDADTRVNLQLSGRHIDEKEKILDLDNVLTLSGEVESLFANDRWKLSTRFNIGLNHEEYIVSPEVAFLGWENFELYSAYHYLDGDEQTVGGFYRNNNMLTFGLRGNY